jgi:superfamily II DNA or RNA helicase
MGTQLDKPVRKLRDWQKDALDVYFEKPRKDFLALVTPGGGKTIFALTLATLLESVDRIVVVCPSVHIKSQWESAAEGFGIDLDSASITTTYQQVASTPEFFAELMAEMPTLVIFDEIHHASDSNSWGKRILEAFQGAEARVCLTGTAFRSDTDAIPFVVYENEVCCPDYVFGYGQAANSEPPIVRLLEWPVFDGEIGWRREGEEEKCRRFSDRVRGRDKVARLSACLNPEGGFMHSMLTAANDCLNRFPGEAALAICKNCKHADAVADAIARITGTKPAVVHSKDEMAAAQLEAFRDGTDRWIVSVKMLSEGVDVPRLRVLVYATNTCTEMFFRQAMGRIVRGTGPAICYIPAHPPFLKMVQDMHMERLHDITKKEQAVNAGSSGGTRGKVGSIEALSSEGWEQRVERVRLRRKGWAKDSPAVTERRKKQATIDRASEERRKARRRAEDPEGYAEKLRCRKENWRSHNKEALRDERSRANARHSIGKLVSGSCIEVSEKELLALTDAHYNMSKDFKRNNIAGRKRVLSRDAEGTLYMQVYHHYHRRFFDVLRLQNVSGCLVPVFAPIPTIAVSSAVMQDLITGAVNSGIKKPTPAQHDFILAYCKTLNGAEAARQAGFRSSRPGKTAMKILKSPHVAEIISICLADAKTQLDSK